MSLKEIDDFYTKQTSIEYFNRLVAEVRKLEEQYKDKYNG